MPILVAKRYNFIIISDNTMARQIPVIAPSVLAADFARLGDEVREVLTAGADWIHFDVMDHHYVPNLTLGAMGCRALRNFGVTAPIDVHLMVEPVVELATAFAKAGATGITFHPDAVEDAGHCLRLIRQLGCSNGLVLNPDVEPGIVEEYLPLLDMILVMSVYPGFGGQKFIEASYDKLRNIRKMIDNSGFEIRLEVDGGVGIDNIAAAAAAGADTFVAGAAVFGVSNRAGRIAAMREAIELAQAIRV